MKRFLAFVIILCGMTNVMAVTPSVVRNESTIKGVSVNNSKSERQLESIDIGEVQITRYQQATKRQVSSAKSFKSEPKQVRSKTQSSSINALGFSIYDAWVWLDYDSDGDGYYSEFTLSFDADYSGGSANVFADIWLSFEGGDWFLFHTTDVFTITGVDANDYYSAGFTLNTDYPTGSYDIAIDLYDADFNEFVATLEPIDDIDLSYLPLEDQLHEVNANDTLITFVATGLSRDLDFDSFYTRLTLEYDIQTFDFGRVVYAEIDIIDTVSLTVTTRATDDFVLGNQTEFIDLAFTSGYAASWYDIEIRLIDAYTGEVIELASEQNFDSLSQLTIESDEHDVNVTVHVRGGGSFGFGLIGLLLMMGFQLRRKFNV